MESEVYSDRDPELLFADSSVGMGMFLFLISFTEKLKCIVYYTILYFCEEHSFQGNTILGQESSWLTDFFVCVKPLWKWN